MSVYIKGMSKDLAEMLLKDVSDMFEIVEIPTPHGDLIDRDHLDYKHYKMHDGKGNLTVPDTFGNGVIWINDCINEAPSIIEAEEEPPEEKSCSTCGYSPLTPSCDTCEGYSNWWPLEGDLQIERSE